PNPPPSSFLLPPCPRPPRSSLFPYTTLFRSCGAIVATLEELRQPTPHQSPNLRSIVDRIRPSVEPLLATPLAQDAEAFVAHAVRDRKSTRLNSSHLGISYAVFCLKKKKNRTK